ncbi:MAG: N-acetylmuramoyl-L-alanine amidase [Herbinix sp.]|nr:N-acetylmuramoyl-L-alanine amidase [Herbinix sp.]
MNRKILFLMSKCVVIILLLISQNPKIVSADTGGFTYNMYESGIAITHYNGNESNLIIPQQLDGYVVVAISQDAFSNSTTLTSIVIPDSVTYIGNNAFSNCFNLASIRFMGDAPTIGEQVFVNCKSELTLYYEMNKRGFTNPWNGLTTAVYSSAPGVSVTGITLDTTSTTLLVGETIVLLPTVSPAEATNKNIRWTSSNPNVAAIDSLGQITALKSGDVEITAMTEDGSFTAACKISIINTLVVPSAEFAVAQDYDKVKVSWKSVTNATGYEIYRYKVAYDDYVKIATVSSTEFKDSGLSTNTKYSYKVRAYRTLDSKTIYSDFTSGISVKTLNKSIGSTLFLYMSSLSNRNSVFNKAVQLHYGNPTNTCAITVSEAFRRLGLEIPNSIVRTNQVEDHLVARGWKREMNLSLMQPGDIGFTTDRYGNLLGGHSTHVFIFMGWANKEKTLMNICDNQVSRYSTVLHTRTIYKSSITDKTAFFYHTDQASVSSILKLSSPVKATVMNYNSVKVSWKSTASAYGYKVYRSTSRFGSFEKIATTKNTSYTNTKLTTGKMYYYKVRAYNYIGPATIYGSYSDIIAIAPTLSAPAAYVSSNSSGKIKLKWNAVNGANGYQIYQSASENGSYTRVSITSKNPV